MPRWRNWQTRYLEVVVRATGWRFESSPGHFTAERPSSQRPFWGVAGFWDKPEKSRTQRPGPNPLDS